MAKYPCWRKFTQGTQNLMDDVVNGECWSLEQIRSREQLAERSEKLFHEVGSEIWPDERGDGKTPWLAMTSEGDLDGRYPMDLFYSDEKDRKLSVITPCVSSVTLTFASLLETFNENIRLKCEAKHVRTITKTGDWKYVSCRKRKRTSGSQTKRTVDVDQLEDQNTSASDDDEYEPDPGAVEDMSSELSEDAVVDLEESTAVSTLGAVSTASHTPPSTGRTPSPHIAEHHVWCDGTAPARPAPPTAPRSMLARHMKRVPASSMAILPRQPLNTLRQVHSRTAQKPNHAPAASSLISRYRGNDYPIWPMQGNQSSHSGALFPMAPPATNVDISTFPMYDRQSDPRPRTQLILQPHGRNAETPPAGSVQDPETTVSPRQSYFTSGNVDRFHPKYHPRLPKDWRRGHKVYPVVYQEDQAWSDMLELTSVQESVGHKKESFTDAHETVAGPADVCTASFERVSPEVWTAGPAMERASLASESRTLSFRQAGESSDEPTKTSPVMLSAPASPVRLASPSKKRKVERKKRCDVCKARKKKCDEGVPCGQCKLKGHPELCVYSAPRVHFAPSPTRSSLPEQGSNHAQEVPMSSKFAAASGTVTGALVDGRNPSDINSVTQSEEMEDGQIQENDQTQADEHDAVDPAILSEHPHGQTQHPSQSPERAYESEAIKQEPHIIKRELLSPETEGPAKTVADEGTQSNPIDLDMTEPEDDDIPPRNSSCVEVDAGDGVAFCTSFKICKSTEEFFAFVSSLVPSDIEAVHSRDTISSVMVRFANPTKLGTSKMRVYRQRGGPTIVRLNEQLNAPMESSEAGLKFVVEWQCGANS